ncbi:hypothetical protein ACWGJB_44540 [Streptomyces sp. NPDC054813]
MASYDSGTQTWSYWIGALGLATVETLQTLFDAARTFGTEIHLAPAPVPDWWTGPAFTGDPDIAALLAAKADDGGSLANCPSPERDRPVLRAIGRQRDGSRLQSVPLGTAPVVSGTWHGSDHVRRTS